MYAPNHFVVTDEAEIDAVLRSLRLGCLTTCDAEAGLQATHMPFLYDAERRALNAHVARANPHWRSAGDTAGLVIFQGVNAYVSPSWYPSKHQHGRVVPTWNYEAVHVRGRVSWRHEADWLVAHVSALSDRHEAGRAVPWAVSDAPADYIQGLAAGIVGLELAIEQVEVTRKMSQNRSSTDRLGVIAGLSASEAESDRAIAAAMQASQKP
jgi:transcriptional regulator